MICAYFCHTNEPILVPDRHVSDTADSTMNGIVLVQESLWEGCANLLTCLGIFVYRSPKQRVFLKLGGVVSQALIIDCCPGVPCQKTVSLPIELERDFFRIEPDYLSFLNRISWWSHRNPIADMIISLWTHRALI